jgi:putative acetyltransferase
VLGPGEDRPLVADGGIVPRSVHNQQMISIRISRPDDGERAIEIWRHAVDATHHFLIPEDRQAIDAMVCDFLPKVPLWLAVDTSDYPLALMFIDNGHMEALFVAPAYRGNGIGATLVRHGLALHSNMTTDVNEQNLQALGFYEKMGFTRTGRSALDGQGRPYPIIHLEYGKT